MRQFYDMEDLFPIVKELAEKYTGKASTSVTYETAQQLMGAVLYCINEIDLCTMEYQSKEQNQEKNSVLYKEASIQAREAYEIGYQLVIKKVKEAHNKYNEMILFFHSYGNIAYKETIEKGMPSFFQWYDPKLNPQNHIIMMDYPVLISLNEIQGVDIIYKYLECIELEQKFLEEFSETVVRELLVQAYTNYEDLFINVCGVIIRKILIHMLIGEKPCQISFAPLNYEQIGKILEMFQVEELKNRLTELLEILIKTIYQGDRQLFQYLKKEVSDFAVELVNAAEHGALRNVV